MAAHDPANSSLPGDSTNARLAFLAAAGEVLASSLDFHQTLQKVARLAIPVLGDLCIVDVVEDGQLRQVATAHGNSGKAALLEELRRRYPPALDSPQPAARVFASGEVEWLAQVTPDVVASHTLDEAHAALIRAIGIRSHIAVPLVARDVIVGAVSFGISESDRAYGPDDVTLARDLARRAALAIDNARLYEAAQQELAERRRAEDAMRVSEERFRAMFEQSPLSTQILSSDALTVRVNGAWERLWGLTLGQLAGYNMLADPQLEASGIVPLLRRAFDGEATFLPTIRYDPGETIPDRGGDADAVRWVSAFAYPVKDSAGIVREVVLVHQDVTELRQRQDDLRVSEERTRLLADAGAALGASLDYHTTLQDLSRLLVPRIADWCAIDLVTDAGTLERVAVYHADPARIAIAQELFARFPPRRDRPHSAWQVIDTRQPEWIADLSDAMIEGFTDDGEQLALVRALQLRSVVSVPLIARDVAIGVLTVAHAESHRRYAEADLALMTDLARRAAVAVDNARLYDRLRTDDRRKNEFLATLAHELRNPLAPIRTGLALLRVTSDPPVVERTRQMMDRQLSHMVTLIDELLDLSRVTRGKIQLDRVRTDLLSVLGTAIETSRPLLDAAGVQFIVRVPEEPVVLDADRTRLAQVVSNLLNNAAKFTERGGRVELAAVRDGDELVMTVTDTGSGIPPDMLAHVFDMFVQVRDGAVSGAAGLGIGLTLVRRLVELHDGRVWAESEGPGKGSTFYVVLPIATTAPAERLPSQTFPAAAGTRRRVLVVDDNVDAADMLAALLAYEGHEVRVESNGVAALTAAAEFRPDVAFLDIGLPGMNGYELARRLRLDPAFGNIVLIAVTGWGQQEDRQRSHEAGFDEHLTKPVDPDRVVAIVAAH